MNTQVGMSANGLLAAPAAAAAAAAEPQLAVEAAEAAEAAGFFAWVQVFQQTNVLLELLVLLLSALLALGLVWLLRRARNRAADGADAPEAPTSIWLGRRLVDGVLFPALWLSLAYAGFVALMQLQPAALFRVAIPMLVALVVIRVTVRVLQAAFSQARWLGPIERTISWAAWLAVLLWLSGLLPLVLHELDQITWQLGGTTLSVRNLIEGTLSAACLLYTSPSPRDS